MHDVGPADARIWTCPPTPAVFRYGTNCGSRKMAGLPMNGWACLPPVLPPHPACAPPSPAVFNSGMAPTAAARWRACQWSRPPYRPPRGSHPPSAWRRLPGPAAGRAEAGAERAEETRIAEAVGERGGAGDAQPGSALLSLCMTCQRTTTPGCCSTRSTRWHAHGERSRYEHSLV